MTVINLMLYALGIMVAPRVTFAIFIFTYAQDLWGSTALANFCIISSILGFFMTLGLAEA